MRFEVVQRGQIERVFTKNVIYLHKDGWNDWFKYETMFYLSYSDEKGNTGIQWSWGALRSVR